MAGQSRRWMILLATVWIQAFTGTNFDFSSYSSELKAAMGISQVQLNYLAVASDLGKAFGWSSGLALLYLPLPAVLFLAAALGFVAYGAQWLLITSRISLPYAPVFILCLLAGLSICWFNTVCFVLCIRNFSADRCLALSLTGSFNGVSASLYTLLAKASNGSPSSYLLLNAVLPVLTSLTALIPILRQPPFPSSRQRDTHIFFLLNSIAFLTGIYLLILNPAATNPATSRLLLAGALILLALPLAIPGIVLAREWALHTIYSIQLEDAEDHHDIHKELIPADGDVENEVLEISPDNDYEPLCCCCCYELIAKDRLVLLGEEHGAKRLISRLDFWIYYISYFCGGTLGLVYSNNLGQIAQSLGRHSQTSMLVNVYSSCSFFGRLFSAAPDFLGGRVSFARTGWLAVALVPMPLAFFLLATDAEVENGHALLVGTALVGLSSGFVFAGAVSVTSELFGPESFGVNHNIVIINIPLGSQLYGLLAALVYDANGRVVRSWHTRETVSAMIVCMGRRCYSETFLVWGGISMLGLAFAVLLYLRTREAYNRTAGCVGPRRVRNNREDFR